MLGKIIEDNLTYPPHKIVLLDMQIFNPTEEQLIQDGDKPITITAMPEDLAPEGQDYEAQYTDGDTITQSWVLVDNPPADTSKTLEQRVTDLENNQNDMNRVREEVANSETTLL